MIYIDKTERILVHRLKEHQTKEKNDKQISYQHIEENPTQEIDYENIQLIKDRESSNFKLGTITYSK